MSKKKTRATSLSKVEGFTSALKQDRHILVTPTSVICQEGMIYAEWAGKMREVCALAKVSEVSLPWWIGDLILAGSHYFEDMYETALSITGYTVSRLRECLRVCRAYEPSRRSSMLTFEHHFVVVRFDPDEQDRWLRLAESRGWSVRRLRAHAILGVPIDEDPPGELIGLRPKKSVAEKRSRRLALVESINAGSGISDEESFRVWWDSYGAKSVAPMTAKIQEKSALDGFIAGSRHGRSSNEKK